MDRVEIFTRLLAEWPPGRLLDLGAGHGKFSIAAHDLAWQVTAVDARTERMPRHDGIEWIQSDVRDFPMSEDWDCIAILGLLYHLELSDVLDLLKRCAGTRTVLDTHVALRAEIGQGPYEGKLFREELEAPTAAWKNPESFWPTEDSLVRILHDCGYRTVLKLLPEHARDRTFWVCS